MAWIPEISKALNSGLLPEGYYALAEQHAGRTIPDILTLHASPASKEPDNTSQPPEPVRGGIAVADAPPRVRKHETVEHAALVRRRTIAVRHVSGHRLVAMIEILSPANKDRRAAAMDFAAKAVDALDAGVHLLVVDLFPPGPHDPQGIHGLIRQLLEEEVAPDIPPPDEPLILASYAAGPQVEVYLEYRAAGAPSLANMPLFLQSERYITIPLEATYAAAYQGMPVFWRNVLESDLGG